MKTSFSPKKISPLVFPAAPPCNRIKGARPMAFLLERIRRRAQELHKIEYYSTKDISEDNG